MVGGFFVLCATLLAKNGRKNPSESEIFLLWLLKSKRMIGLQKKVSESVSGKKLLLLE